MKSIVTQPWATEASCVIAGVGPSGAEGLSPLQAKERLREFGPNVLAETQRRSALSILLSQFRSFLVAFLTAATVLSFVLGDIVEGIAIIAVILINAVIGFVTELRAVQSMDALRKLTEVSVKVRRGGQLIQISSDELVPGDIVVLEGGDVVAADLRLTKASRLQVDESSLTGESVPVDKTESILPMETVLAERRNMLHKGTSATRGTGEGVVTATGMSTELGHISRLIETAEDEITPLEQRLDGLAKRLIVVTLGATALIVLAGMLGGKEWYLMLQTGIALAVAAIPEGLPIVATIALARGMWRMAKQNALINRLSAVETLGVTTVICTDKTGTLTENKMTLVHISVDGEEIELSQDHQFVVNGEPINPESDELLISALEDGVLCNNAVIRGDEHLGDPLEIAFLVAGHEAGIDREDCERRSPRVREEAFDSDIRMMATYHQNDTELLVAVKGAAEPILAASTSLLTSEGGRALSEEDRRIWLTRNEDLAKQGHRVLALAQRSGSLETENPYEDLTFIGLAGLVDPQRSDVLDAITQCRDSGIRVIMATGDQPATAAYVAREAGLVENADLRDVLTGADLKPIDQLSKADAKRMRDTQIFARLSPKQKLDLIELHQRNGEVVAMTGDGVNDAPALKEANIGIAMGVRGTEVAREASDMVLKDDAFSTIVSAVCQGRIIFGNIRRFVIYLLSCNLSEILVVGLAAIANAPLPILPLQILFLNMVTDVFPALALGASEGDPRVMKQKPRGTKEAILQKHHWRQIVSYGFLIAIATLGAFAIALGPMGLGEERAVTVSFLVLAISQLFHVFNMREQSEPVFSNQITRNRYVWWALLLCASLLLIALQVPILAEVLHLVSPTGAEWGLIFGASLVPLLVSQILQTVLNNSRGQPRKQRAEDQAKLA